MRTRAVVSGLVLFVVLISSLGSPVVAQSTFHAAFDRTWVRTDFPVANQDASRTWMWGPFPVEQRVEPYVEAPGGFRQVLYFDKSRMEITNPDGDQSSIWFVTNGLLVVELVTGRLQLGNSEFENHMPAEVNVAGDANDPNGPTYLTIGELLNRPPLAAGEAIIQRVDRQGIVSSDPALAGLGITADHFVQETNHRVAGPFWDFMNSTGLIFDLDQNQPVSNAPLFANPFFATGLPITEAYWARVQVGGTPKDVLLQCFERRCLTYTPDNPPGWQVEAGNVGLHYRTWRYEQIPVEPGPPDPTVPPPPAVGDVLYESSLTDWEPLELNGASMFPADDGYHIRVDGDNWRAWRTDPDRTFTDFSVRVNLRLVTEANGPQLGCVIARNDVSDGQERYALCIDEAGRTAAAVDRWGADGQWIDGEVLLEQAEREAANPASEWNTLQIIASGDEFWFAVNDTVVGSVTHSGASGGSVGLEVSKGGAPGSSTEWVFADLEVRGVGDDAPPPPPPPPPEDEVPSRGDVIAQTTLEDWVGADYDTGSSFGAGGTFHIRVTSPNEFIYEMATRDDFGDSSVSLDVRLVEVTGEDAEACVMARTDVTAYPASYAHAYVLCVTSDGLVYGGYEGFDESETYFLDILLDADFRSAVNPVNEWNNLEIILQNGQVWFFANGMLLGNAQHDGPSQGGVGFLVTNIEASAAEFEFRNLVVRGLQ